jgi:DNA-binding NarL/FixJ family response regulator
MIRVLIVDNQQIICDGLQSLLEVKTDLEIVGTAENGKDAIQKIEQLQLAKLLPDIVLMDIRMPVMNGITATRLIQERFPQVKVLVLTTFDDEEYIVQAIQFGAKGYLLKDTPSDELSRIIYAIHAGYTQLSPGLLEKAFSSLNSCEAPLLPSSPVSTLPPEIAQLSSRERAVLHLIAQGSSNREISEALFITERTVKNYVTRILSALQLRDRTQAALFASAYLSILTKE